MDLEGCSCSDVIVQSSLTRGSLLLSIPPRKVSFEDSRNDSNPSICSDNTVPTKNNEKEQTSEIVQNEQEKIPPIRGKRSLLVRPITSLSLVDLAKSAQDSDSSLVSGQDDVDRIEGRKSKRVYSSNLSPRSIVPRTDLSGVNQQNFYCLQPSSNGDSSKSIRASPWGHFIDMAPDEDDYGNLTITAYPSYDGTLKSNRRRSSCSSHKKSLHRTRRRPSPYGEYKSYTTRGVDPTLTFVELSKLNGNFRLSPRSNVGNHESADDLIGVFSGLQVQKYTS
jgi:hypothetical protein